MDWLHSSNSSSHGFLLFCLVLSVVVALFGKAAAFNLKATPFDEAYSPLFGHSNVVRSPDGNAVRLLLDRFTGNSIFNN